jgi:cbb3-type cytochrome oxidase maturation protein
MSVLLIAVPAALAFAISAVIAFLWASRTGQLDDLDTPPLRMLHDESSRAESEREPEPGLAPSGMREVRQVAHSKHAKADPNTVR